MKTSKFLLFLVSIFLLFGCLFLWFLLWATYRVNFADTTMDKPEQIILVPPAMGNKGSLPVCMNDTSVRIFPGARITSGTSLHIKLSEIGELPIGYGIEKSKISMQRKGLAVSFTLEPKAGNWSFLTTDRNSKTCLVATGIQWHKVSNDTLSRMEPLVSLKKEKKDAKQVGYSAPFKKMEQDLLQEGKFLVGYGKQDINLSGTRISKVTTYFFTDTSGSFTAVSSVTQKDGNGTEYEISSVDSTGVSWVFNENYAKYNL
jgi:hypothetical protein